MIEDWKINLLTLISNYPTVFHEVILVILKQIDFTKMLITYLLFEVLIHKT